MPTKKQQANPKDAYDRFEALSKGLVSVPKKEIDEQKAKAQARKKRRESRLMAFVVVIGDELVIGPFQNEAEAAAYARDQWSEHNRLVLPLHEPQEFEEEES